MPDLQPAIEHLFCSLQGEFSRFASKLQVNPHPEVQLDLIFEAQAGLPFSVYRRLEDGVLFMLAGQILEVETGTKPKFAAEFERVARGILSGGMRLVEYLHGKDVFKAELQAFENGVWREVWSTSTLRLQFWRTKTRVLPATAASDST